MRAVNVVLNLSTEFDLCPKVVLEAFGSGIPLMATARDRASEIIEN